MIGIMRKYDTENLVEKGPGSNILDPMTNCGTNFIRIYNVNKGHLLGTPMQITIYITGIFIHNNLVRFHEVQ